MPCYCSTVCCLETHASWRHSLLIGCDGLPENSTDPVFLQLHFADDSQEQPVEIYHKLKLYDEADPNNPSTKKPVRSPLKAASPCP